MSKAPQLPKAPPEYSAEYMNKLVQALDAYFKLLDIPGPVQASSANFSWVDRGEIVRGLVRTNTLSTTSNAGATTLVLVDASEFRLRGGYGTIVDGVKTEKFKYTGKSGNTLTGVTLLVTNHTSGRLVVDSGRIGELFADPLNDFVIKIIP